MPSNTACILWFSMHCQILCSLFEEGFGFDCESLFPKFEFAMHLHATASPAWISVWRSCSGEGEAFFQKICFQKPSITCHLACSPSSPYSLHYSSSHNSRCVNNCSVSTVSNHQGWEGFSTGGMAAVCGKTGETGHVRHVTTPQRGARSHFVTVSSLPSLLNHMLLLHSFSECTHCEPVSVSHLFVSHTSFSSSNYAVIVVVFSVSWLSKVALK